MTSPATRHEGRPGGAVRAHPFGAMADHPFRRGLGHRRERDRAAARSVLSCESAGASVHANNPSIEIFRQAISIDERRRMFRLQPGTRADIHAQSLRQTNNWEPQDRSRSGLPACMPISAAAIRKRKRAVEISAALDDRGGGEMRPRGRPPHRQPARLGPQGRAVRTATSNRIFAAIRTIRCRWPGAPSNTSPRRTNTKSGNRAGHFSGVTFRTPSRVPSRKMPLLQVCRSTREGGSKYHPENLPSRYQIVPMPPGPS